MSRSGYTESDDCDDDLAFGRWRGQLASAIRGRRGQRFLKQLIAALDSMPVKELIRGMVEVDGACCAMGAVARSKGVDLLADGWRDAAAKAAVRHGTHPGEELADLLDLEGDDWCRETAKTLDVAHQIVSEVVYLNDEGVASTPEERWREVRAWAVAKIAEFATC